MLCRSSKTELSTRHRQLVAKMSHSFRSFIIVSVLVLLVSSTADAAASQTASPLSWMTQMSALSGQAPKLSSAPLIQLDTGAKYYKIMFDGMMMNFKKAVARASERSFSLSNVTSTKPIDLVGKVGNQQQQRVSIQDIQIDGLANPKVSSVYVSKEDMKLHVVFNYKTIQVWARCLSSGGRSSTGTKRNMLLEATNWSTSWSADIMQMIGRNHFDLNKVFTQHTQQRLSLNLEECPQSMQSKLKTAILDRVRTTIDSRLVEIMETVMIHTDSLSDEAIAKKPPPVPTNKLKGRGKRASQRDLKGKASSSAKRPNPILAKASTDGTSAKTVISAKSKGPQEPRKKVLKRIKRQTPCQQGEELDDYVDQLFRFGTRIVRAMEPITLPNATIELPDYNLKIFLYEGRGTRAYKFRRAKPAWVYCSNETISLGLTIEVEELRVAYKYRVISGYRLLFDGDLEAKLSPKAQAQFSQAVQEEDSEEPVQQRVDRVRLFRLGRVHVLIRGLGNLTQSLSMLINSYLNDNQEDLQPTFRMVEGDAVRAINRILANVNVPLLSVV